MNRSSRKVSGVSGSRRLLNPVSVGAVILILVLAGVVIANSVHKHNDKKQTAEAVAPPAVFTPDGRLHFGSGGPLVTVTTDFQCPICHQFEVTTGPTLTEMLAAGTISVDYDTVAVLDGLSKDRYSSRSANASVCVAVADKNAWPDFSKRLFDAQPAENGPGLTDDKLIQIAADAGVTGADVADCVHSSRYAGFVAYHSQQAITAGLTHVPVIKVGDTTLQNLGPDALRAAVAQATPAAK